MSQGSGVRGQGSAEPERERRDYDAAYEAGVVAGLRATGIQSLGERAVVDPVPFLVVPAGHQVVSLEDYLGRPTERRATVTLADVASFIEYVQRYGTESVEIAADQQQGRLTAHLDYHEGGSAGAPGTCAHVAYLQLQASEEWKAWTKLDGASTGQVAFAEFLEDHLAEIVEPDGAVVLQAARHLEASKSVKFRSGINLSNGSVQLLFEETVEEKAAGQLVVPTAFTLGLAPYEHSRRVRVDCRLRYRIVESRLLFVVKLDRPDRVLKAAFKEVCAEVEKATGLKPLQGSVVVG